MEIKWTVSQLDRATVDGCVQTAHWSCTGVDGEFSANVYSTTSFQRPEGNMASYEQLTQNQVLGWVWANGVDKAATEAAVADQIKAQKNPVTATGTPWE